MMRSLIGTTMCGLQKTSNQNDYRMMRALPDDAVLRGTGPHGMVCRVNRSLAARFSAMIETREMTQLNYGAAA